MSLKVANLVDGYSSKKRDFAEAAMNNDSVLKAFLFVNLLGINCVVSASPISCTGLSTLGLVDHASACERSLTVVQDVLASTVNSEAFFGNADWSLLKTDDPAGNGQTGVWVLSDNEWMQYSDIMLVFSGGADTTLLGFLLSPNFASGNWSSPFSASEFTDLCIYNAAQDDPAAANCSDVEDTSHISYYTRGAIVSVSEPAPLLLMALGLVGLVLVRRQTH